MSAPVFNRSDTLLGVCEALGQDLGFNAQWLRIALAVGVFWNLEVMAAAYLGLGVAVWVARWLTPARVVAERARVIADNDDHLADLAAAA